MVHTSVLITEEIVRCICKALHQALYGEQVEFAFQSGVFPPDAAFRGLILKHHDKMEPTWRSLWHRHPVSGLVCQQVSGPAQKPPGILSTPYLYSVSLESLFLSGVTRSQSWRQPFIIPSVGKAEPFSKIQCISISSCLFHYLEGFLSIMKQSVSALPTFAIKAYKYTNH